MAIARGLGVGVLCGVLAWLILTLSNGPASASPAANDPGLALYSAHAKAAQQVSGQFIVLEGPLAGTMLSADETGKVSIKGERHGFIRAPDADCPHFHFEGVEGGKGEKKLTIKETDCLRVVPVHYATGVVQYVAFALRQEEAGKLGKAVESLQSAARQAGGTPSEAEVKKRLKRIIGLDKDAQDPAVAFTKKTDALLERAEKLKHKLIADLPLGERMYLPPTLKPLTAVFDQANTQTVYTWDVAGPPGTFFQYQWVFAQLNDPTCNQFSPNAPLRNQATYRHGDTQGPCNHALEGSSGHQVAIGVTFTDLRYSCSAAYFGSNTGTGPAPPDCTPQI